MDIQHSAINKTALLLEVAPSQKPLKENTPQLNLGDRFSVRVSGYNHKNQQYTLRSDTLTFQIKSYAPLEIGGKIQIEVTQKSPILQFHIITQNQTKQITQQTLRNLLATQLPLDKALTPLLKESVNNTLPKPLTMLINQLFSSISSRESISTVAGLKLAVQNSGMFLEKNLGIATTLGQLNKTTVESDLKMQLFRIVALLRQLTHTEKTENSGLLKQTGHGNRIINPTTLLEALFKKLSTKNMSPSNPRHKSEILDQPLLTLLKNLANKSDAAVARQHLNQLNSLMTTEEQKQHWVFELPINTGQDISFLKLRIKQNERNKKDDQEQGWQITINFELPNLGPFQASLYLKGCNLTINLWNNHPEIFEKYLPTLSENLHKHGLDVKELNCHKGLPKTDENQVNFQSSGLLDIEV